MGTFQCSPAPGWRYQRFSWYLNKSPKPKPLEHLCTPRVFFSVKFVLAPMGPRVLPLLSGVFSIYATHHERFCACKAPGDRDPGVMVINV